MRRPFLLLLVLISACASRDNSKAYSVKHYKTDDPLIRLTGRVYHRDSVGIYWSATSIKFRVDGGTVKAHLRDENGKNFYNVVIDGNSVQYIRLDSAVKKFYTLANNLPKGEHTIEIVRGTEWDRGPTWFYGVQVADGSLLELPKENKRVIEFFGNSITAGYAIDDTTGGDSPEGSFTNVYPAYASITARHFNADLYATVKSGIGIQVSWFPLIMPEVYNRLNPEDSTSVWDFNKVQPQIVVINLLQNDSWLVNMPEHQSFKQRFGTAAPGKEKIVSTYRNFVRTIRSHYPDAHIVCALGCMDATKKGSPWPGYVTTAVSELKDPKIHTLFFQYSGKAGHPRRDDNRKMADQLIAFIEKNIVW